MSKATAALFVATAALGATVLHLTAELRHERATIEELQLELERLRIEAKPPPEPPPPALELAPEPSPPDSRNATARFEPAQEYGGARGAREDALRAMRENAQRQRILMGDPAYRDALRLQHKTMLAQSYPDVGEELGLTADETDHLLTLLAEQQLDALAIQSQLQTFDDRPPDSATIERVHDETQAARKKTDAQIEQFLGPQRMQDWREYQQGLGTRYEVGQLSSQLAVKGAPLRDDQLEPLRAAYAAAQRDRMQQWERLASAQRAHASSPDAAFLVDTQETQLQLQREQNERLRHALSAILTPEQLRHVEAEHERQLQMQQAHLQLMRAQAAAEARGEIPAENTGVLFLSEAAVISATPGPPE